MNKLITNLQATIKHALKKDVVFEKVNENEYCTQSTEPDKIAFFALRENFKVRKNNNTLTLTVPRGTLAQ
jgi:hypothetical protein